MRRPIHSRNVIKARIGNGPRLSFNLQRYGLRIEISLGLIQIGGVNPNVEKRLHVVFGPPASGKTVYARQLAKEIGGCFLDSDVVTERMVRAGLELAEQNPDERDSPMYRKAYRDAVYETLFDIAVANLPSVPVVIAGPFTREGGEIDWPERLAARLGELPEFHFVWADPELRRLRMSQRGEERDGPKLADWENYVATCREVPPVFPHRMIVTG